LTPSRSAQKATPTKSVNKTQPLRQTPRVLKTLQLAQPSLPIVTANATNNATAQTPLTRSASKKMKVTVVQPVQTPVRNARALQAQTPDGMELTTVLPTNLIPPVVKRLELDAELSMDFTSTLTNLIRDQVRMESRKSLYFGLWIFFSERFLLSLSLVL
jgi:hypothetical protein